MTGHLMSVVTCIIIMKHSLCSRFFLNLLASWRDDKGILYIGVEKLLLDDNVLTL